MAVRFLIAEVWQKVGMEQIPLWERYGHRCMNNRTIGQTLCRRWLDRCDEGRKPFVGMEKVKELVIGRASVYRALG